MSNISSVGGANSAWAAMSSTRASAMKDKMFAKVDSDGSGSVDKTELQSMLDHISSKTGSSPGTAEDLFSKMDTDGDGGLNKDEMDAGMKSLMPAPSSTVDFAQRSGGSGRPPPPHGGGGGGGGGAEAVSSTSSSSSTDPLDTDGDGTVSAQEKAAGALKELMKALVKAADTDGDHKVSSNEASAFTTKLTEAMNANSASSTASNTASNSNSSSGSDTQSASDALSKLVAQAYSQAAANYAQESQLSVAA